jgi:hypothetical protein
MDSKSLLTTLLGAAVVLFLLSVLLFQWLSRRNTGAGSVREYEELRLPGKASGKQAVYSGLQRMYAACERVPPLRAYVTTVRRRLSVLQLYDEWKLRLETMKIALAAWGLLLAAAVPFMVWIRDPTTLLMLFIGVWVGHGILADSMVHRLENRLLRQLRHFLADIRHHYHRHRMVEEAIYDAADAAPYEMALHGLEIHAVLTASHPEERLEQYYETAPNRFLKGLAGLSYLVKEYGDKIVQNGSLYLHALGRLATELNLDILRREKLSYLLQGLTAIALIPLLFTKPIESWASRYFPAMDDFYGGKLGWMTKIAILLIVLGSYILLRKMQELGGEHKSRRRKRWERQAYNLPWMRWIVDRLAPAPGTREAARIAMLLKETNSPLRPEWFWVRRVALGVLAFVLALGLFVAMHGVARHHVLYAIATPDTMFGRLPAGEEEKAKEAAALDRRIIADVKGMNQRANEKVMAELGKDPQLARDEAQLRAAAQRIMRKLEALNGEYLKWWEILLALLTGWGGYHAPVGVLMFERRMRQMEMKHEVDQLHAVIGMLAEMDRMSVEHLLEWMERFAVVFKEPIQHCLLHYEHGAVQALDQLKEEAPFLPFVRTVEKLQLAVENIPIRQAFDDLESERVFAQEQRKQDYERLIEAKAGWGRMIGFAPMMSLIFGYLVFPFVYVSLDQMSVYYEQIQRIQ